GETNESLIVEESGTYSLETVSNGCSMFSENIVMEILGFEDLNKLGVSVYPNPVENTLHIDVQKVKAESLKIYDVRGDMIYQSDEVVPNEINLSDVKKGIYIVNIITKNQIINFRVKKK
ncbi:MAG: T9SS type A sorting domain-containing protein, partial [Cyclobacteriaceae bacterium]|nr:T9SS type A sorting domain-containing protein [Cyclobacteriaceae bacterium]